MKQHTKKDSVIDRRNHYQGRMIENEANIIYFTKRKNKLVKKRNSLKIDTKERAELNTQIAQADKAIKSGKDNIEADKLLLSSFDKLLRSF